MSSYSRQQLEDWLKTINVDTDSVVDIGGSQLPIKKRVKSWKVNDYKILDLDNPHECKQEPQIVADINDEFFYEMNAEWEERFDVAFCLEVSEYWWNPYKALENINYILKKEGKLYISFHFIYPVHNPVSEDCLRYTENGAIKLLENAGFKIENMEYRYEEGDDLNIMKFYQSERMRPSKEYLKHNVVGTLITAVKK